jgi:hypothetical protein
MSNEPNEPKDWKSARVMICNRVGTASITILPGSSLTRCARCEADCWVSPASLDTARTSNHKPLCVICATEVLGPLIHARVSQDQLNEVAAYHRLKRG